MKKISEIYNDKTMKINPFLHGVLFSRILETKDQKYFIAPISFKESKYSSDNIDDELLNNLIIFLNKRYAIENNKWVLPNKNELKLKHIKNYPCACVIIENDLFISKDEFLKLIYFNLIAQEYILDDELNDEKKDFIRGFFESRGSIDLSTNRIAIDYYYDNDTLYSLKRVFVFSEYLCIPPNLLDFNFRNLQGDYIQGIERNAQFRIRIEWYLKKIGISIPYKVNILNKHYSSEFYIENDVYFFIKDTIIENKKSSSFIDRVNFYSKEIHEKELSKEEISSLRISLGFDSENVELKRSSNEKLKVYIMKPDICVSCCDLYDLNDRTFLRKNDNSPYLEIHHNIPFSNDKENLDNYHNMVKLCPVCHLSLRKNITSENKQKEIISNIIKNDIESKAFASWYFNTNNNDELVNKIFESLK